MTELPEWVRSAVGFDPDRWWLPFFCMHGDSGPAARSPELLTVLIDNAEHGLGYIPTIYATGENFPITQAERDAARAAGHWVTDEPKPINIVVDRDGHLAERPSLRRRVPARKRGSINVKCPTCNVRAKRFTRNQWVRFLSDTRASDLTYIDLYACPR